MFSAEIERVWELSRTDNPSKSVWEDGRIVLQPVSSIRADTNAKQNPTNDFILAVFIRK
jgi:hypothetical protein